MKKNRNLTFVATVSCLILAFVLSCNNDLLEERTNIENQRINAFLQSQTFKTHYDDVSSYGSIDFENILCDSLMIDDHNIIYFMVPIKNKGKLRGYIEAVDLNGTKFLPNDDQYAMNYVDMNEFDTKTYTGIIRMVDLNYDNFIHSTIDIVDNKVENWRSDGLSTELIEKYVDYENPHKAASLRATKLCDGNGNGNISFSECYNCMSSAIEADGFSRFICEIPVAGWASCWASKSAACVYISAVY